MPILQLYNLLNHEEKEIRLIELQPAADGAEIQCSLYTVSLLNSPLYEALSYFWGQTDNKPLIYINNQPFTVTRNLYQALLRLRLPASIRTIWVDAICINQSDTVEKAYQVSLMSEIYSKTTLGLLWLGDEPGEPEPPISDETANELTALLQTSDALLKSTIAMINAFPPELGADATLMTQTDFNEAHEEDTFRISGTKSMVWHGDSTDIGQIGSVFSDTHLEKDSILHAFCLLRMLSSDQHLHQNPYFIAQDNPQNKYLKNAFRAVHYLMSRPWWRRIWTVQESILPTKSMILYGGVQAPWEMFLKAASYFQRHRTSCCTHVPGIDNMLNYMVDTVGQLDNLKHPRLNAPESNLTSLLRDFRYRNATNPKDKVYALLPLVKGSNDVITIIPDYDESTTALEVYTRTVLSVIKMTGTLDILCQPTTGKIDSLKLLPSWATDFSLSPPYEVNHFNKQIPLYNACAGVPAKVAAIEQNILVLEGYLIDTIPKLSYAFLQRHQKSEVNKYLEWYEYARDNDRKDARRWKDDFWRTLCGDTNCALLGGDYVDTFWRAESKDIIAFQDWCKQIGLPQLADVSIPDVTSEVENAEVRTARNDGAISHAIKASTSGRKFVISSKGYMGMGPIHIGLFEPLLDEIYVFPGGKTPFVLRPVGARHIPGLGMQHCHALVGECYLHGFMDGEGLKGAGTEKKTIYLV